jgi:hypothetical protein
VKFEVMETCGCDGLEDDERNGVRNVMINLCFEILINVIKNGVDRQKEVVMGMIMSVVNVGWNIL